MASVACRAQESGQMPLRREVMPSRGSPMMLRNGVTFWDTVSGGNIRSLRLARLRRGLGQGGSFCILGISEKP